MFTPINTSFGALLLHQGASGLLQHNGRVFGISSLLSGCLGNPNSENAPVIAGLISGIAPVYVFAPSLLPSYPARPHGWETTLGVFAAGLFSGWGTKVRGYFCCTDGVYT